MLPDTALLSAYAQRSDQAAFAEFVRRHLGLVYFAALRRTGGQATLAEEIAQRVFVQAGLKAAALAGHATVAGWLYTTTRNLATDALRSEAARARREQEAHRRLDLMAGEIDTHWEQVRPLIDRELDALGAADREAILLRFFSGLPFAAIGEALHTSEDAARVRVNRALEKLRVRLRGRGFASTAAALGAALGQQALAAPPAHLAAATCSAAFGAAATGTTAIAGTAAAAASWFGIMSMTKIVTGAAVVIAAGCLGFAVFKTHEADRAIAALSAERDLAQARASSLEQRLATASAAPVVPPAAVVAPQSAAATTPLGGAPAVAALGRAPASPGELAERAKLHRRYDPFLQKHGLNAQQAERFVELMLKKAQARADVQAAVAQMGVRGDDPRILELRKKLDGPLWNEIDILLGPTARAAFSDYEFTSAYRVGMIDPIIPEFAQAGVGLSGDQADQLARLLGGNVQLYRASPTDIGQQRRHDWDAIATQAAAVLTPAQQQIFQAQVARWKSSDARRTEAAAAGGKR